jgi:DUF1680 family protein
VTQKWQIRRFGFCQPLRCGAASQLLLVLLPVMSRTLSPKLLEILRTTLDHVEQSFHTEKDQPAVHELKQSVAIAVAELERDREDDRKIG